MDEKPPVSRQNSGCRVTFTGCLIVAFGAIVAPLFVYWLVKYLDSMPNAPLP